MFVASFVGTLNALICRPRPRYAGDGWPQRQRPGAPVSLTAPRHPTPQSKACCLTVINRVDTSGHMKLDSSIEALSALAQATRLEAFRLLVKHEPDGLPAGEIARRLNVPHNTMSTHLAILARAGLVSAERQSRIVVYRAGLETLRNLTIFLIKDCCDGNPALCAPVMESLSSTPTPRAKCLE